jgi:hypothetical protein
MLLGAKVHHRTRHRNDPFTIYHWVANAADRQQQVTPIRNGTRTA